MHTTLRTLILISLSTIALLCSYCNGQTVKKESNGLLYSDNATKQLKVIAESKNKEFLKLKEWRNYYGLSQGICNEAILDSGDVLQAKSDMERNISFEDFYKKYPTASVRYKSLAKATRSLEYSRGRIPEFTAISVVNGNRRTIISDDTSLLERDLTGKWAFRYYPKTNYQKESIEAFYFLEYHQKPALPEEYARMIRYSDFIVDTNTTVFAKNAQFIRQKRNVYMDIEPSKHTPLVDKLMKYINERTFNQEKEEFKTEKEYEDFLGQRSMHLASLIDSKLSWSPEFTKILKAAIAEAIETGNTFELLEYLAEKYDTKAHELALRRQRIEGPEMPCSRFISLTQNYRIAQLAAETAKWDLLLRTHLEILGDGRSAPLEQDSSGQRRTLIKELELIGLDIPSLLFGIALLSQQPAGNHYDAYLGTVAAAIAESKYAAQMEDKMITGISCNSLDTYNRYIVYSLYRNYLHKLPENDKKAESVTRLRAAAKTLPQSLADKIIIRDIDFVRR